MPRLLKFQLRDTLKPAGRQTRNSEEYVSLLGDATQARSPKAMSCGYQMMPLTGGTTGGGRQAANIDGRVPVQMPKTRCYLCCCVGLMIIAASLLFGFVFVRHRFQDEDQQKADAQLLHRADGILRTTPKKQKGVRSMPPSSPLPPTLHVGLVEAWRVARHKNNVTLPPPPPSPAPPLPPPPVSPHPSPPPAVERDTKRSFVTNNSENVSSMYSNNTF